MTVKNVIDVMSEAKDLIINCFHYDGRAEIVYRGDIYNVPEEYHEEEVTFLTAENDYIVLEYCCCAE